MAFSVSVKGLDPTARTLPSSESARGVRKTRPVSTRTSARSDRLLAFHIFMDWSWSVPRTLPLREKKALLPSRIVGVSERSWRFHHNTELFPAPVRSAVPSGEIAAQDL